MDDLFHAAAVLDLGKQKGPVAAHGFAVSLHDRQIGIDGRRRPPLRLAVETIRLAREAVSTHLILSARLPTEVDPDLVGALAVPESAR